MGMTRPPTGRRRARAVEEARRAAIRAVNGITDARNLAEEAISAYRRQAPRPARADAAALALTTLDALDHARWRMRDLHDLLHDGGIWGAMRNDGTTEAHHDGIALREAVAARRRRRREARLEAARGRASLPWHWRDFWARLEGGRGLP